MTGEPSNIQFMLYNVVTRRLLPNKRTVGSIAQVEAHAATLGEGDDAGNLDYVLGHYDNAHKRWVDWDGIVRLRGPDAPPLVVPPPVAEPVTEADVRAEAAQRLMALYGARDRSHLERRIMDDVLLIVTGDEGAIARRNRLDAVDAASKALRKMSPIPADYRDARYWPD